VTLCTDVIESYETYDKGYMTARDQKSDNGGQKAESNDITSTINLCSQGPGTKVTSPEVYESIDSEQYVFPAVKEDGISNSHTKFQMNCSVQQKVTAS
jgi:hypothetical protein